MSKLKILFITHYASLYGANNSMLNLINGLSNEIEPYVVVPSYGKICETLNNKGIKYKIIHIRNITYPRHNRHIKYLYKIYAEIVNFKAKIKISQITKSIGIDIIHSNSSIINIGFLCAKKTNIKHVWHLRELYDLFYGFDLLISKKTYNTQLSGSDALISISNIVSNHFEVEKFKNNHVIPNGVVSVNKIKNETVRGNYFVFCASIDKNKGIEDAIYAFSSFVKKNSSYQFIVLGEAKSDYFAILQKLILDLNISDKVVFKGFVTNVLEIMGKSKGLLICSRFEAMGRTIVEAWSQNCPVIGYNDSGISEVITHQYNGLLYNNIEELLQNMELLIENKLFVDNMTKNAVNSFKIGYTEEAVSQRILSIYHSI